MCLGAVARRVTLVDGQLVIDGLPTGDALAPTPMQRHAQRSHSRGGIAEARRNPKP